MAGRHVHVPDLVGFGWEEARDMARAAGLNPQAVGPDGQTVNGNGGVVIDQKPAADARVAAGTDVALRVAFGGGPAGDSAPLDPFPQPYEFRDWLDELTGDDVRPAGHPRERELVGPRS